MRHLHSLLAMCNSVWTPNVLHQWRGQNWWVCGPRILLHSWWLILVGNSAGHCLFDLWGDVSLQHKPGLLHSARSSWCHGWDMDWTNSFCKYCVSTETLCWNILNECIFSSSSRRWTSFDGWKFWPSQRHLSISLDTGRRLSRFYLHLANILFDIILPSILGSSLWSFG